jgi:hypothetical protein
VIYIFIGLIIIAGSASYAIGRKHGTRKATLTVLAVFKDACEKVGVKDEVWNHIKEVMSLCDKENIYQKNKEEKDISV